ncbi:hypothetical protein LCGC14_1556430 [marine sediment metagenome]|uniref:Uncharacterized protein n=1 Tax=marine sediment metagenome TaxID=412755 RepID=A0A0F9J9S5_9ZZZZ
MTIECRCCKTDTKKRKLIKRYPLKKVNIEIDDGYDEYYCSNTIESKRPWYTNERGKKTYKITTEECRNRILVKKTKG